MMDRERITRRLADISQYMGILESILPNDYAGYRESPVTTKASTERYLQLLSDIELEVMILLYKGLDLGIAGDEDPLINKMGSVISKRVIEGFRKRRSLRNLLVHAYYDAHYDVDAFEQAGDTGDIKTFIREVKVLIGKH